MFDWNFVMIVVATQTQIRVLHVFLWRRVHEDDSGDLRLSRSQWTQLEHKCMLHEEEEEDEGFVWAACWSVWVIWVLLNQKKKQLLSSTPHLHHSAPFISTGGGLGLAPELYHVNDNNNNNNNNKSEKNDQLLTFTKCWCTFILRVWILCVVKSFWTPSKNIWDQRTLRTCPKVCRQLSTQNVPSGF